MREKIMNMQRFWIIRFNGKRSEHVTSYVTDTNPNGARHSWWYSEDADDAYKFATRGDAKRAIRSPFWAKQGFTRVQDYAMEVVEIRSTTTQVWEELSVISNENALIQLARLGEINEDDDDSDD